MYQSIRQSTLVIRHSQLNLHGYTENCTTHFVVVVVVVFWFLVRPGKVFGHTEKDADINSKQKLIVIVREGVERSK